jgi:hypothetical protein
MVEKEFHSLEEQNIFRFQQCPQGTTSLLTMGVEVCGHGVKPAYSSPTSGEFKNLRNNTSTSVRLPYTVSEISTDERYSYDRKFCTSSSVVINSCLRKQRIHTLSLTIKLVSRGAFFFNLLDAECVTLPCHSSNCLLS